MKDARHTGGVYNIGGGSRVELLDVFELIRRITGRPLLEEGLRAQYDWMTAGHD